QNLEKLVETGEFRKDLYYRLNVVPIEVPALRNRPGDIIVFAEYFAAKYANLFQKNFVGIAPSVLEAFQKYSWPGNVRELENSIEYMINLMGDNGVLSLNHLPTKFSNFETEFNFQEKTLKDMEIEMISTLIHRYGHSTESKKHISKILGIGIATLYRKLELYNIKH
ncbi:MAG: sigma 54-interacting transcriptional regulator, partial [Cetobacterium sp.]